MALRRSSAFVLILAAFVWLALPSLAVAAEPSADVDPLNDPWLSEDGPPVAPPAEVASERVAAAWGSVAPTPNERTEALLRARLEFGLGDLPAPASVIAARAEGEDRDRFTARAEALAPGIPAYAMDHALALWGAGDIGASIGAMGRTLFNMGFNLKSQLWILENVALVLLVVLLSASLGFVLLAALRVLPHAAHDLGDLLSSHTPLFAGVAGIATLLLLPMAFGEGIAGLALALFTLAFAYGDGRQRSALVMAGVLIVIGIHPLAQVATVATELVDRDPVLRSVLHVLDGTESEADVMRLEAAPQDDLAALHALAYRARRFGLQEESRERLDRVLAESPADGVALANRGNIERRRGNTAEAIGYYERAASQLDSPTLLFSLSQAYASAFRMEEYESTLVRAQRINDREVAALSNLGDATLSADLVFPMQILTKRLRSAAMSPENRTDRGIRALAPGFLGDRWYYAAGAFAVVALMSLLFAGRWDHSSQCVRCGHRICTRCEETVWSDEICEDCHHLFQYPESTDPSLRMARLQALAERESRIDRLVVGCSLLIPGAAGFAARRPDYALFGLLLASWVGVWLMWPSGVFADPMLMGASTWIAFGVPGVLAVLAYLGVVGFSLMVRKAR